MRGRWREANSLKSQTEPGDQSPEINKGFPAIGLRFTQFRTSWAMRDDICQEQIS
jgi:hypothetical protein